MTTCPNCGHHGVTPWRMAVPEAGDGQRRYVVLCQACGTSQRITAKQYVELTANWVSYDEEPEPAP